MIYDFAHIAAMRIVSAVNRDVGLRHWPSDHTQRAVTVILAACWDHPDMAGDKAVSHCGYMVSALIRILLGNDSAQFNGAVPLGVRNECVAIAVKTWGEYQDAVFFETHVA